MLKRSVLVLISLLVFMQTAAAADYLTADQARALFTNKTFDGVYLPKNKAFKAYEDPDGMHNVLRPNGKRDKNRKWYVNDAGQHCTTNPKWKKARCSHVADAGNGEYHKYSDKGKHTHTLTNFRDGNQL